MMENNLIKEEWINGIVMMSPRPQYNHMELEGTLYSKLKDYFSGKCKVAIENALFLTKDNPVELKKDLNKLKALVKGKGAELVPDVAVYCDNEQIFKRGFLGVPQLVIEVLSPSNADDDTEVKKEIYRKFGVPEYWIVSPMSKKVYVYSIENGRYELKGEYKFLEEEIKSSRFEDLILDMKDIELIEDDEDDI
jgi:Uma2 family endonuclease